ncbi:MAG: hypothetical protein DRI71_02795 [Bacteroidetes bacterium]|nr:MAG: hypothetical protein DRI71_02795 [Bacteroidota bacterium]
MRGGLFIYITIFLFSITASRAADNSAPKLGVNDVKSILLSYSKSESNTTTFDRLQIVLSNLTKKQGQYKKESDFVEYLYYYTHRKLLKKYDQYASLSETLTSGTYDCLTATAVYSILFTELSVPHAIVETNYHIYILVYPDSENEILLETTDPTYGFISNTNEIEHLKSEYRLANGEQASGQVDLNIDIERRLEDQELIGLLFYNQSVNELNRGNWQLADDLANEAINYYSNARIIKLLEFIDSSYKSAAL